MPRPQRPWFRLYVELFHDPDLRRLPPADRWLWVAILGAARWSPIPGQLMVNQKHPMGFAELSDWAAMPEKEVRRVVPLLLATGMLDVDGTIGAWVVANWKERQFESDDTTERTRKHRSRERDRNVPTSFPGTPPESESESESELLSSSSNHVGRGRAKNDDDGDGQIGQALRVLAEADLRRREAEVGPVGNREAWIRSAVRKRRADLGDREADLAGLGVAQVVEALAPVPVESEEDRAARAAAALRARCDMPPCRVCDDTGWKGGDPANGKCACGRLLPDPTIVSPVPERPAVARKRAVRR